MFVTENRKQEIIKLFHHAFKTKEGSHEMEKIGFKELIRVELMMGDTDVDRPHRKLIRARIAEMKETSNRWWVFGSGLVVGIIVTLLGIALTLASS